MRIVAATTDEEMLHTIIGAQILGGTMSRNSLRPTQHGRFCPFPMWRRPVPEAASTPLP